MRHATAWQITRIAAFSLQLLTLLQRSGLTKAQGNAAHATAAATKNTFFYMDGSGSYRYTFDSGNGIEGEQSANQANEVTGHYTYHDAKGVPYMVRYRAGVQGYQPEVLTAAGSAIKQTPEIRQQSNRPPTAAAGATQLQQQQSNVLRLALTAAQHSAGAASSVGSSSQQPTFQFVQTALRTMQTQPVRLSFNSMHSTGDTSATTNNNSNMQQLTRSIAASSAAAKPSTAAGAIGAVGTAAVAVGATYPYTHPQTQSNIQIFGATSNTATGNRNTNPSTNSNGGSYSISSSGISSSSSSRSSSSSTSSAANNGLTQNAVSDGNSNSNRNSPNSLILKFSNSNNNINAVQRLTTTAAPALPLKIAANSPILDFISQVLQANAKTPTSQLVVRVSHLPHGSYNYKVDAPPSNSLTAIGSKLKQFV